MVLPATPTGRANARPMAGSAPSGDGAKKRLLTMRVYITTYLYESGSGESEGFANSFFSSGPIGTLRFNPFGGIFCVNHLS
jgi:hypothetical protein